jgi:hypothetical protein
VQSFRAKLPAVPNSPPATDPAKGPEGSLPDDDSLEDLPPLDGEGDEADSDSPAPDLDDDELLEADADPFDDSTGEGDPVPELEGAAGGAEAEAGWLEDADDAETLDVGAADILGVEEENGAGKSLLADNDALGVGDEDFDLGDDRPHAAQDAGEEGPEADDEALREEDLPSLDADDAGEGDDESFFDELSVEEPDHAAEKGPAKAGEGRPWDAVGAWPRVGAVHCLACATKGILAAQRGIVGVDLEGAVTALAGHGLGGGDVTGLCFDGEILVAATERGGVLVSRDGGASFVQANGWRERVSAHEAASGIDIALGAGELWGRTTQGKLLYSSDQGASWETADLDGFVLAIAVDDKGSLVALASALGGTEILRGRGRGAGDTPNLPASLEATRLPHAAPEVRPFASARITARGPSVAFAVRGGSVHRSLDGHAWHTIGKTTGTADVAFIDGTGTVVAAVVARAPWGTPADPPLSPQESTVLVVQAGADSPGAHVVASVEADASASAEVDGTIALEWDEAHGVVWLGGAFGLSAFQPSMSA